jgi:formylglycine-generating enzyme required for sulfatase activity
LAVLLTILLTLFVANAYAQAPTAGTAASIGNSLGMQFVQIPAGEFRMGSPADDPDADADERPQHVVRISRSFHLGRFEVTQAEYRAVTGENPSWFSPAGGGRDEVRGIDTSNYPVEFVTWEEANEFCRRLAALPAERAAGRTYRLPTEAEWEYAARAETTARFPYGDNLATRDGVVRMEPPNGARTTRPVGSRRPNAWGLFDMHGNVWEWCADRYDATYYETVAGGENDVSTIDPLGPATGTGRVVRGGDYRFDPSHARSANRDFTRQSRRDWGNGFRIVLVAVEAEK